ncbi:PKS-NRPS hybrid synthetase cheA-like [Rhododendron vialii]|uniref:PKS-NRPS hybrid synthetase cheA-like n=1 Tax=Rhododendron vialii TaxID=182163 RepID=UPI00265F6919|nr:PKS-NRPS hybrid synthetase cheA-like [Rhododendron vialii]
MRFSCERSGKYRPFMKKVDGKEVAVKKRVRSTGTKKCECSFELKAVQGNDGWTVSVHNGTHNHPPAVYLKGYSYVGRLSAEQTSTVVDLSVALVKPREILTHLKVQDHENVTSIKTVYNVRQKYRVIVKAGKFQMQHLLDRLEKYKYVHWTHGNETENVTELFWSPTSAGEMLRAFPRVLMMDCTYKTNKYKFPLLQIVGVTSTKMTFCTAFAFMECEKTKNYTWVVEKLKDMMDPNALPSVIVTDMELALMNVITNVFPHATNLLCRWHIGKNVLVKCRKMFDDKMWEEFISLEYVEKNWLVPYKERFVGVWTDKVMHFGNLTSNRTTLFDMLRGVVSSNTMTLVLVASHQVEWLEESKRQCECSLRHTHGLPCAHEIAPYKMANIPLPIELIHDHWKRLSLLAPRNESSMEETLLAHFDCFYNKFLNEDQYNFPEAIRPYIESVKDVEDDGNCGFWQCRVS